MSLLWPSKDDRQADDLLRARDGDSKAFVRLYRQLHPDVFRFIARRVANRADAEDLTARVFCKFLERMDQFDRRKGKVRSWVLTVARNLVIDHYRTSRKADPLDTLEQPPESSEQDPLTGLLTRERVDQVRLQISQLPDQTREILAMRYADGLRHREIAAILGLSEAAVKKTVSRARRELKSNLQPTPSDSRGSGAADYAI
ncbi:MAG: RNA polymerase sigma factor [Nannocystaceae bacterium]